MTSPAKPLKPLTAHARSELARIQSERLLPRQELNPGVADRLLRGALVASVQHPSPYKTHKGAAIEHLQLTEAGQAELKNHARK